MEWELAQVRGRLEALEEVSAQAAALDGERAELERRREGLSRDAEAHRALARKRLSDRYARAEEEYQAARRQMADLEWTLQYLKVLEEEIKQGSAALTEAEERSALAKEAARDEHFPEMTGEEAVAKAVSHRAEYQSGADRAKKLKKWFSLLQLMGLLGLASLLFRGITQATVHCLWVGVGF